MMRIPQQSSSSFSRHCLIRHYYCNRSALFSSRYYVVARHNRNDIAAKKSINAASKNYHVMQSVLSRKCNLQYYANSSSSMSSYSSPLTLRLRHHHGNYHLSSFPPNSTMKMSKLSFSASSAGKVISNNNKPILFNGGYSSSSSSYYYYAVVPLLFLAIMAGSSDPVISYILKEDEDANDSYWMHQHYYEQNQKQRKKEKNQDNGKTSTTAAAATTHPLMTLNNHPISKLRNPHRHHINASDTTTTNTTGITTTNPPLPNYSRIVIVGGGMAGLHTALALAERMNDPTVQDAHPPSTGTDSMGNMLLLSSSSLSGSNTSKTSSPSWRNWLLGMRRTGNEKEQSQNNDQHHQQQQQQQQQNQQYQQQQQQQQQQRPQNEEQIIVLEGSLIGNFASGRAKGLVVPGFQVPLEDLEIHASDYHPAPSSPSGINNGATDNSTATTTTTTTNNKNNFDYNVSIPTLLQSVINRLFSTPPTPKYTKRVVGQMYDMTYVALDRLRDIVEKYEIDCDWVDSGALEASIHSLEEEKQQQQEEENTEEEVVGKMNAADGAMEKVNEEEEEEEEEIMLSSEQVNSILGIPSHNTIYKWGEYDPSCAGVNPLDLTLGLADAAESWGVKIFEHTKVAKLEKNHQNQQQLESPKGKFTLVTKEGHKIQCDHIVLCTGAETLSSKISKRLSRSFIPIYTWMAATEPLYENCPLKDGAVDRIISNSSKGENGEHGRGKEFERPAPMCGDDHVSLNYWRRTPTISNNKINNRNDDGRILFGSLADSYPVPTWFASWRLRNALTEIYPQLQKVRFDHVWGGKLAFSLNSMPLIGRDIDYDDEGVTTEKEGNENSIINYTKGGVWYATGFAGHGIVPTAMAGSVLANAILGIHDHEDSDEDRRHRHWQQWQLFQTYFPPSPWNGTPCSRVGAGAVLLVYNLWDWLGKRGIPLPPLPKLW